MKGFSRETLRFLKNRIFWGWLVSYVIMLIIPLILGIAIHSFSSGIISSEVKAINSSALSQFKQLMDGYWEELDTLATHISLNEYLQRILNESNWSSSSNHKNIKLLIDSLYGYHLSSSITSSFYIYLHRQDAILDINAFYSSSVLDELNLRGDTSFIADRHNLLHSENNDILITEASQILNTRYIYSTMDYRRKATLVYKINMKKLSKVLKDAIPREYENLFIADENHRIIATAYSGYESLSTDFWQGDTAVWQKINWNGKPYEVSYVTSASSKLNYAVLISEQIFYQRTSQITLFTIICLALALALGILFSYMFTRRNYSPVDKLVELLPASESPCKDWNHINDSVHDMLTTQEHMLEDIRQQKSALTGHMLMKLLHGEYRTNEPIEDLVDASMLEFHHRFFAVAILRIEFVPEPYMYKIFLADLQYNLENADNPAFSGYAIDDSSLVICVINIADSHAQSSLHTYIQNVVESLCNKYDLEMAIAVSDIFGSVKLLVTAYWQALEVLDYLPLLGEGKIACADDIKQFHRNDGYPNTVVFEDKLRNIIRSGKAEEACSLIRHIMHEICGEHRPPLPLVKCLLGDIIGVIIKSTDIYDQHIVSNAHNVLNTIYRISSYRIPSDLYDRLDALLKTVCARHDYQRSLHGKQVKEICSHIREHYADENLNASVVADTFGINLSHLSRIFKEECNSGLYEYICRVRIEAAKKYLTNVNLRVNEIAQRTGFTNESSFIRVFKKIEGVTPGRFREITRCAQENMENR